MLKKQHKHMVYVVFSVLVPKEGLGQEHFYMPSPTKISRPCSRVPLVLKWYPRSLSSPPSTKKGNINTWFMLPFLCWCRRRDLNPHELPHSILSRARLPFRHFGIPAILHEVLIFFHFQGQFFYFAKKLTCL